MSKLSINESFEMILLQAGGAGDLLSQFGPLILIVAVFYFFFIRPQNQKNKAQKTFVDNLQKGDDVVTASGIFGKVNKIEDDIVTLQVDTKTFIRFTRGAISKDLTEGANASSTNESTNKS
ncbi:MAG: preprotein translocase subunit YajC [Bacteroidota bacterium]